MGSILALEIVWASVAVPLMDRDLTAHSVLAVQAAGSSVPGPSHDHRLCLLLQSSPGLATSGPAVIPEPVTGTGIPAWRSAVFARLPHSHGPSARSPPFSS